MVVGWVQGEELLDGAAEDLGEGEGEGERGDVAIALNGINALARDAGEGCEFFLGPAAGLAEVAEAVVEGWRHGKSA
jgi:hypothetical protein